LRGRIRLALRELGSLRAEKTVVLALLIQLFIAAFSSFLVVGLVSLYDPGGSSVEFAVTGDDEPVASLADVADAEEAWTVETYEDPEAARESFETGDADVLLTAERGGGLTTNVTVVAPRGELRTTLTVTATRELLRRYEETERQRLADELGADTVQVPDGGGGPYHGFTYAVLIPLLMFLPVFISGSITSDTVTEEYERGTLNLLRVSPLSNAAVFDGKTLTPLAIAPAQAALWLALLRLNGVPVAHPLALLAVVTGVAAALVGLGAGVGLWFRERKQAQFVYSVAAVAVFGVTFALPESSANTVARLGAGSATLGTYAHVAGYAVAGVVVYAVVRRYIGRKLS